SAAATNVTIDGLTITGGNAGSGSAITASTANLTVTNCVIKGNSGGTGTIYVPPGRTGLLKIQNPTISGNTALTGGIYTSSAAALLLQNPPIPANSGPPTAGYNGGGIIMYGTINGNGFTVENSTFVGNSSASTAGGGAINFDNVSGTATIRNCTITGNTAT